VHYGHQEIVKCTEHKGIEYSYSYMLGIKDNWTKILLSIPITDSPKSPPLRIMLTTPVLNGAKRVAVILTGASKADVVTGCLQSKRLMWERIEPRSASWQGQTNE
jgi:hypothetical protein